MKSAIRISAVIAVVIGMLGWRESHHAVTLRDENHQLRSEAAALGISESEMGNPHGKRSVRVRDDREAQTMDCFRKLVSVMKKSDQSEDSDSDPAIQAEMIEVLDLLYRLDGNQIRDLIEAIQRSPDFDEDTREGVIGASVMILGTHHPSSAAAIFTGSPELFENSGFIRDVMIGSVVVKWGELDPLAAYDWIRAHQADHPEIITEEMISALVTGTAARNPKLAIQFIKDLGIEDSSGAIYSIGAAARTGDQRDALMQTLKEIQSSSPGGVGEEFTNETMLPVIRAMAEPLIGEGFEVASAWMKSAKLDEQVRESISGELHYSDTKEETGRWIDWLAKNVSSPNGASKITHLMEAWTEGDHRAAGSWLAANPESPARQAAVLAYANTVASYDPDTAARWADTVSDPNDRAALLKEIEKSRGNR